MSAFIIRPGRRTARVAIFAGLFFALCGILVCWGEPSSASPSDPTALSGMGTVRSIIALLIVLGGLLAANWFLKNRAISPLGGKAARRMKMIEKFPIDQKRSLLLMSLDGREILLGVGGDHIQHLVSLPHQAAQSTEAVP